ncbi:MAG: carboxypeptidase-like regulatory domain-containing protein [Pseudomonadota bacterium]
MRGLLLCLVLATILFSGITSAQDDGILALQATGGTISGMVTDASTGSRIGGATVTATPGNYSTTSASANPFTEIGSYVLSNIPAVTYQVSASKSGYDTKTVTNVAVTDGSTTTVDLALTQAGAASKIQVSLSPADGTVNEPVTITAISPGTNVEYKFYVNYNSYCTSPTSPYWQEQQNWTTTNTFTWTPTSAGEYTLVIWTKDTPTEPTCANMMGMTYWVSE